MTDVTVLISTFGDEGSQVVSSLDSRSGAVLLDGSDFPAEVNRLLPTLLDTLVCVTSGVVFRPGWLDACSEALDLFDVVSPWVQLGGRPRAWHEPISPYAFVLEGWRLADLGGLDERVTFHYHALLAENVRRAEWTAGHIKEAVVVPVESPERNERLGALYYDQLRDAEIVRDALA